MKYNFNNNNLKNAKNLRKQLTKEERKLWYGFLKSYPVHFYKQRPIGKYIADFYCGKAKLVIELDGSQHYENEGIESDAERDEYLKSIGITVLRIPNNAVNLNFSGVCEYIDMAVKRLVEK